MFLNKSVKMYSYYLNDVLNNLKKIYLLSIANEATTAYTKDNIIINRLVVVVVILTSTLHGLFSNKRK